MLLSYISFTPSSVPVRTSVTKILYQQLCHCRTVQRRHIFSWTGELLNLSDCRTIEPSNRRTIDWIPSILSVFMPGVGSHIHLGLYWQKVYVTCDRGHLISCSLHNIVYINLRLITSRCLQRVWFLINSMLYYVFYTCTFFEICSRNLIMLLEDFTLAVFSCFNLCIIFIAKKLRK